LLISALIATLSLASKFESGSSNKNTFGFLTIALPTATRCLCPPDNCLGFLFNKFSIPNISAASSTL